MRRLRSFLKAASTGFLLVLAFPGFDLSFLAWVALVPLLLACARETLARRRFLLGWIAGVIFFGGTCNWVYGVMRNYGSLGMPAASGVLAAMVGGLALYGGLFAAVLPAALSGGKPLKTIAGVGALWTATEFARGLVFIGFPWLFLGYTLTDHLLLARLARFTGVYGLSFLVAGFNAAILLVVQAPRRARGMRLAAAFLVLAAISLGGGLLGTDTARETAYLMQTAIPISQAWDESFQATLFPEMESKTLARYARSNSEPGLLVWPEAPGPFYFHEDPRLRSYFERLARQTGSYLAANVVAFEDREHRRPLNSAVMLAPDGRLLGQYDKIQLVPFGEHVPWPRLFSFAGKLTAEVSDFVPGRRFALLPGPKDSRLGVLICYEAGFPGLVRRFTARGAQALVNVSNDGWFGDSAARRQHLLMVRMRAIENDRWVLRATNDGITCVIDPAGRVQAFEGGRRAVYAARYGLRSTETLYARWGDWFALLAVALAAALVLASAGRTKLP